MTAIARRTLRFQTMDEAMQDAKNLLANGYDRVGKWSLAQCCDHLTYWLNCQMDGFGKMPLVIRMFMWTVRNTVGPTLMKSYLKKGEFPAGGPTDPQSVPPAGGDDSEAVDRLEKTVERYKAHTGPIHPSPVFGPMNKETAMRVQLVHMAHHLSFLVPKNPEV